MAVFAHDKVLPDEKSDVDKKNQVAAMFNSIARRYDFLNRFLSVGIDKSWRKKAIKELKEVHPKIMLDVATGTGDVAIVANKLLNPDKIIGIDISEGMLELGRSKIKKLNLSNKIELLAGDSETINYQNSSFDAITVAFGVRNFAHLEKGLTEMLRVLKPGGKISILECTMPKASLLRRFYSFYMFTMVPAFGKLFAKNKQAYKYLNNSVRAFPDRENFMEIMQKAGFRKTYYKSLSFGICCIYCGSK
ncbi:MAG TPA: bifunctional demethylmenaquinone methyltransferase/2-methoxy-6-polyprenyl-1,4-benzoquinol methylase UbiE [Parafilimonas sp.]|nr:bifunctional demethylmenaquinone methyltransferase/2-methoxy-6-polyprenyl-1,4-benzoquinol methylase UbiE [Parafilimonas sp.]